MKKLLRPVVLAVTVGLGLAMFAGCAPRNPKQAPVAQHVCKNCGHMASHAAKCPSCKVDMAPTTGTTTNK